MTNIEYFYDVTYGSLFLPRPFKFHVFWDFLYVCARVELKQFICTVSKHGNSMTIFNLSISAQLGCKLNVLGGCVPANPAEVD